MAFACARCTVCKTVHACRMLSNRESARRSRKRKQEQLQELEGQIETLEKKTASLESQCQAAAVHVQKLMTDKQQLENENQHLMSIFQQLQVRRTRSRWLLALLPCASAMLGGLSYKVSVSTQHCTRAEEPGQGHDSAASAGGAGGAAARRGPGSRSSPVVSA